MKMKGVTYHHVAYRYATQRQGQPGFSADLIDETLGGR
jgi:hypothetical protein